MSTIIKTYSELRRLNTLEDRFEYLALYGSVGRATFGHDRWLNQQFYTSRQWRQLRQHVIVRDNGCDLGVAGYEIHSELLIHHMNPITPDNIKHNDASILEPEFLITTTKQTHNAIHFGDASLLRVPFVERRPGDTKLW